MIETFRSQLQARIIVYVEHAKFAWLSRTSHRLFQICSNSFNDSLKRFCIESYNNKHWQQLNMEQVVVDSVVVTHRLSILSDNHVVAATGHNIDDSCDI